MSTPEANFEIAVDGSNDDDAREKAIEGLEAANECDMLAELATSDDVEETFREQALANLGHPQCYSMLERLVENGELSGDLHDRAETLLEETPEDAGAGP